MLAKADEYLSAGGHEVWVIDPDHEALYRCIAIGEKPELFTGRDTLSSPLFPGLEIALELVFE